MSVATNGLKEPLGGLPRHAWLERVEDIAEADGFFQPVGDRHSAIFLDRDVSTLIVTFEELDHVRLSNPQGQPTGFPLADRRNWSHLCVLAHGETWYRDPAVYGFFDRLIDDGFFEDFDRVVFYGAEMGGYGAAAFSVASPGSTVIIIQPVATLSADVAGWDPRFRDARRFDFQSRFGYAPAMVDGASSAFVIYDPQVLLDAVHAVLFDRAPVTRLACPYMGNRIEAELDHMGVLQEMLELAGDGRLTRTEYFRLYRRRRNNAAYLRRLLDALELADRPYLAAMLCRNATKRLNRRRFLEGQRVNETRLAERGRKTATPHVLR